MGKLTKHGSLGFPNAAEDRTLVFFAPTSAAGVTVCGILEALKF
jgi:hypothetical protein